MKKVNLRNFTSVFGKVQKAIRKLSEWSLSRELKLLTKVTNALIKLGNCGTWNRGFVIKLKDSIKFHNFGFLLRSNIRNIMKNFWTTGWKDFIINRLFKIAPTEYLFNLFEFRNIVITLEWNFHWNEILIFFK